MSELTDIEAKIKKLQKEQSGLHKKAAPLNARLLKISEELRDLGEQAGALRVQAAHGDPDWKTIIKDLAINNRSSQALLRFAEKCLRERFDMWHSGYWVDTQEAAFELKIERDNPVSKAKNLAGLKYFTPLYTPHKDGWVHFGIFEYTLSEGGVYNLLVSQDLTKLELTLTRYYSTRTVKTFSSPEEAIDYIAANHYYGSARDSDE